MTDLTNTTELVQRGKAAARVGRLDEAREMLRRAVQLAPDNVEAWLTLAAVEPDPVKKMACFETILELDPGNVDAQLGLDMLRGDTTPDRKTESITDDDLETVIAQASRQLEKAVGPPPPGEVPLDEEVLYCANHPNVQTRLRCNRCGKPICTRCAVRTPVGYRCRECVGQQQAVFYTGGALDYVIGGVIALVLSGISSFLITSLGAWFFALILGPTIGIVIAEAVRFAVRRRRSRLLWMVVGLCIVLGAVPALLLALTSIWRLLTLGLFLLLAVGAATARLR
jgi:tetratricopeptide (TPR) repeat protein